MNITGTHINYYFICHRKLWLFANGINMEHHSELVAEGKLIHETSYARRTERYQELELDGIKIDYYDAKDKVIHEVKKTSKMEDAHEWQVKYYIYKLQQEGIDGVSGILEYPKLRKTTEILLSERDCKEIEAMMQKIETIIRQEKAPEIIESRICKKCSYQDFCFG